jgi:hypothetical protein
VDLEVGKELLYYFYCCYYLSIALQNYYYYYYYYYWAIVYQCMCSYNEVPESWNVAVRGFPISAG